MILTLVKGKNKQLNINSRPVRGHTVYQASWYRGDSKKGKSFVTLCTGGVLDVIIKEGGTSNGPKESV